MVAVIAVVVAAAAVEGEGGVLRVGGRSGRHGQGFGQEGGRREAEHGRWRWWGEAVVVVVVVVVVIAGIRGRRVGQVGVAERKGRVELLRRRLGMLRRKGERWRRDAWRLGRSAGGAVRVAAW